MKSYGASPRAQRFSRAPPGALFLLQVIGMSDRWIVWGQRAALALGGVYIAVLGFAGPIATWVPRFSAPAFYLGENAQALGFSYQRTTPEAGFTFSADMTEAAFDDLVWRLHAPQLGAETLCVPLDSATRPKFAMPYQCAHWDGETLVLDQKLSEIDTVWRRRQELTWATGRLSWTLLEL